MKKIILVPALLGVMGIGGLIAVAGNNTFEAAAETGVNGNKVVEGTNKISESGGTNVQVSNATTGQNRLSADEIEKKALELVTGDDAIITDLEYDDEGKWGYYEVDIVTREAEYELKLDAITGELLHKEVEQHEDENDYYDEVFDDYNDDDGYDD